ncbi:LysE family translocator [Dasania sp. GY-MA-18]|uniref:LysE family translocator n=1 Tax=Dasania phycosphaerae TaxID=2950436 RepID=A0A9J6RQX1_9GAMM|nr:MULTISPECIES: LysE family translocator [Dasania]MCR8924419.1 LysE family translocator [Dasania sp. GY-MA-18]MCZ0867094.1 LysE family translocator [Dasania phycosphaerae]MCZ0870546.1 LysE family translocator [Dasania phycosphaerae]
MISTTTLAVFIPTFFVVSATPGMCMTLALTLGISLGLRRTLWMMLGELAGVAIVAVAAVTSVASIMLLYPMAFAALKILGGSYLLFLGWQFWRAHSSVAIQLAGSNNSASISASSLLVQGFITAIANPKGWAFFIALLPPFIDQELPLLPQLSILVAIMLSMEFICMMLYALGGKTLRKLLMKEGGLAWLNRIAGSLMFAVGIWLMAS